jgi:DNA-binding response OmpR family regulator
MAEGVSRHSVRATLTGRREDVSRLQPRILVVDDDPDLRALMQVMLELEGYAVETADNGSTALIEARRCRPDLIVLDLMMPLMDGATFRTLQLADPDLARVPVVITTAAPSHVRRRWRVDAAATFEKPLDFAVLTQTIRRLVAPVEPA